MEKLFNPWNENKKSLHENEENKFYLGQVDGRDATAILSQAKVFDTKRLIRKVSRIDEEKFNLLVVKLKEVLFGK